MSFMDLMPSAEELQEHLVNHDFAVRQIILLGISYYIFASLFENLFSVFRPGPTQTKLCSRRDSLNVNSRKPDFEFN